MEIYVLERDNKEAMMDKKQKQELEKIIYKEATGANSFPKDLSPDQRKAISSVFFELSGVEQKVFIIRKLLGKTLRESGKALGISHERVRQIEKNVTYKVSGLDAKLSIRYGKDAYQKMLKLPPNELWDILAADSKTGNFLDMDISVLDLSSQPYHALAHAGTKSIRDLRRKVLQGNGWNLSIKRLGEKGRNEVERRMQEFQLI